MPSLLVINRQFINSVGQPLAQLTVALLKGTLNGTSPAPAVTTTQPGSVLATVYGDPNGAHQLTNPSTRGTDTLTTDGEGNLCSIINGVTTLGIYVNTSGYGASPYFVLQVYGPGVRGQQLIPVTFPSGGGILPAGANGPFFIGPGFMTTQIPNMSSGGLNGAFADNYIRVSRFMLPVSMPIARCSILGRFASNPAVCSFAIYSADGSTKILDSGTFNVPGGFSGDRWLTNTFPSVVIPAGVYWTAQTDSSGSSGGWVVEIIDSADTSLADNTYTGARNLMGRSSTLSSGGVLPPSINVSNLTVDADATIAAPIWESQ